MGLEPQGFRTLVAGSLGEAKDILAKLSAAPLQLEGEDARGEPLTADLGGKAGSSQVAAAIREDVARRLAAH